MCLLAITSQDSCKITAVVTALSAREQKHLRASVWWSGVALSLHLGHIHSLGRDIRHRRCANWAYNPVVVTITRSVRALAPWVFTWWQGGKKWPGRSRTLRQTAPVRTPVIYRDRVRVRSAEKCTEGRGDSASDRHTGQCNEAGTE